MMLSNSDRLRQERLMEKLIALPEKYARADFNSYMKQFREEDRAIGFAEARAEGREEERKYAIQRILALMPEMTYDEVVMFYDEDREP